MAVYRDDPATEIDEGAEPGEEVILVFSAADDTGGPATAETGVRWTALGGVVRFEGFVSTTETSRDRVPSETALYQNYPNPFNPETAIRYDLRQPEHVKITIFNTRGQHVRTLVDGQQGAGRYTVRWSGLNQNGHTVASGIYFFRLEAGPVTQTRKMILLK
jgi:hypothetical protein